MARVSKKSDKTAATYPQNAVSLAIVGIVLVAHPLLVRTRRTRLDMVLVVIRLLARKWGRGHCCSVRVRKRLRHRNGRRVSSKRIWRERITALGVVRLDGVSG